MSKNRVWGAVGRAVGMVTMTTALQTGTVEAGGLRAGVARAEITPPAGATMWGYSNRPGPGTGTLDPLYAKVLAISGGTKTVALVTLDLGRTFEDDQMDRLRTSAAKAGVDLVMVMASHTHHAPSIEIRNWPSKENPWADRAVAAVEKAVREAAANLRDARISVASGQADQGHNRRHITADGRVLMRWRNAKREPTRPVDKTVTVLRADGTDGKPIALVVHYACHPVVLGPDNVQYSADYPGVMMKMTEEKLGAQCMFVQGACGDINPYMDKTPLNRDGVKHMRAMGEALGREVIRLAGQTKPIEARPASIKTITSRFRFEPRWDFKDPKVKKEILDRYKSYIEQMGEAAVLTYFDRYQGPIDVTSTAILLNDRVAFVGFPGEFFVEFQTDLRKRSPVPHTFFCGYADGYSAYFPTIQAAAQGGYGAGYQTFVEVGAGERMVDQAVINLHRLLGHLSKAPDPNVPDFPGQEED